MDEIFEKLKSGANKFKSEAAKVTKQVVRKTNDAVSQTKLSFAINETENKIAEIYEEMGRSVYRKYLDNGEICEDMAESCAKVDKLLAEIDDLKEKVAELKNSVKCKSCGKYSKSGASYCSSCGAELKKEAEDTETEAVYSEETGEEAEAVKRVVTIRTRRPVNPED